METYGHDYSLIYDLFYQDKNYQSEVNRILELLPKKPAGEKVKLLDIACGTGRHLELLWKADIDVVGMDISEAMLQCAGKRLAAAGATAKLSVQDMSELPVSGETFDAILCAFDAIGYVKTNQRVLAMLERCRHRLKPGGVLLFDFWHAPAMSRYFDPCRMREVTTASGEKIVRISETEIDWLTQIASVTYTFFKPAEGTPSWKEQHQNRFFSVPEMDLFLKASGFDSCKFFPGFQVSGEITDKSFHILAVARMS